MMTVLIINPCYKKFRCVIGDDFTRVCNIEAITRSLVYKLLVYSRKAEFFLINLEIRTHLKYLNFCSDKELYSMYKELP